MNQEKSVGPASPVTLQGWKEIAAYLGRSVRAVQRWERELGLPVRRIKTSEGQTVYANPAEIDEWKKSRELPKPEPESEECSEESETARPAPAATSPFRPTWAVLGAVTIASFVAGALVARAIEPSVSGPIATIQVAGTGISAFDGRNRLVWRHEMGAQLVSTLEAALNPVQPVAFGEGPTYLVAVSFNTIHRRSDRSDALLAFDAAGNIIWKLQPELRLNCNGEVFAGPWQMSSLAISSDTEHPHLWVAFNHPTYWPGLVFEIDGNGAAKLRYRQNGWVRGLAEWQSPQGPILAINGVSNEFKKASTTLLDLSGPSASEPHTDSRFDCADMPPGAPASVFLWPALDVLGPEAYAMATEVKVNEEGLQVLMDSGGGGALAELDSPQSVTSLSLLDNYWATHRQREADGWIKHAADSCPERQKPHPIDHWRPSTGWTHTTIVATTSMAVKPLKR